MNLFNQPMVHFYQNTRLGSLINTTPLLSKTHSNQTMNLPNTIPTLHQLPLEPIFQGGVNSWVAMFLIIKVIQKLFSYKAIFFFCFPRLCKPFQSED